MAIAADDPVEMAPPVPGSPVPRRTALLVALVLAGVTLAVFGRMVVNRHGYVNFDDQLYVFDNEFVKQGLSFEGVRRAWTDVVAANWHPLTMMSHLLDVSLFGVEGVWGHHLVSLLLHVANTVLLFVVLRRMTSALWPSALVAALFAWHPLHVESVAWVSERKDVLSTLFWLLTMWAYIRYLETPTTRRYLVIVGFLALGLLSKPMVVTLPFVLLLLDCWPLGRISPTEDSWPELRRKAWLLVYEKLPLFLLIAAFCGITMMAQSHGQAVMPVELLPPSSRLVNVLMSYNQYVAKTIWPHPLAVPYVLSARIFNLVLAGLSGVGLLIVTWLIARASRQRPYLLVGWLWYLGTLVPVIGLVQVGYQSMADRYSYIPLIGLFILAAFWLADVASQGVAVRRTLICGTVVILGVLAVLSYRQVGVWRDTVSLFTHAVSHTEKNHVAHIGLGTGYAQEKRIEDALEQFEIAIDISPLSGAAHFNRGHALGILGRTQEAAVSFREAFRLGHEQPSAVFSLAACYKEEKDYENAVKYAKEAIEIAKRSGGMAKVRKAPAVIAECEEKLGNDVEAAHWYEQAIELNPADHTMQCRLIMIYAASSDPDARNGAQALKLANRLSEHYAITLRQRQPLVLAAQAAAFAETGDFARAVQLADLALATAEDLAAHGEHAALKLARDIETQRIEYRHGRPYRKPKGEVDSETTPSLGPTKIGES